MLNARLLRWCAISGIVSQVLFFLSWFISQFFEHDSYSIMRDFTSDLGSLTAAHPLPYNVGIVVSGALSLPLAIALFFVFRDSLAGRIGAVLIGVVSVGQFLDGLLREDCSPRLAACKALDKTQGFSWHHQAHDIETLFTALSLIAAPFVFAAVFGRLAEWRALRRPSLAWGAVNVVILVAFAAVAFQDSQPAAGLLERILVISATAWLGVVAWWLLTRIAAEPAPPALVAAPA
jgi:hypothetical protein